MLDWQRDEFMRVTEKLVKPVVPMFWLLFRCSATFGSIVQCASLGLFL